MIVSAAACRSWPYPEHVGSEQAVRLAQWIGWPPFAATVTPALGGRERSPQANQWDWASDRPSTMRTDEAEVAGHRAGAAPDATALVDRVWLLPTVLSAQTVERFDDRNRWCRSVL